MQDPRRRIWQSASEQRFASFAELNVWLATQCVAARHAPHPEYPGMSIQEAWEHEQPRLMPMPTAFDGYVELPARVSSTSLICVARNRYWVPCALAGHRVSVRRYPERIAVVADQQIVAEHPRASDRDPVVYDGQHYLPLIERKPGALRNGAPFTEGLTPYEPLLTCLLEAETPDRAMRSVRYQMHTARFPIHRDLAGFDFEQSKTDRKQISTFATTAFTEKAENIVLIGGTGKTHLATALGIEAIARHGKRVRFCSTVELVNTLENEKASGKAASRTR